MRRKTLSLLIVMLMAFAATGTASAQTSPGSSKPASQAAHHPATTSRSTVSLLNPASLRAQAPAVFDVKFTTTKGDFVEEVTRAWAPRGADRFYNLAKYHFFDNAAFFRVLSGFVVQFGINAKPEISHAWQNAKIADDPVSQSNTRGTLTFATAGPNTRTTQLFINLGNNTNLNGMGFAPFGSVISGMDVVDKLYSEYGEGQPDGHGPDQNRIQAEGKPYLDKEFPLMDSIKTTTILPLARPAATAHAPATASKAPAK